MYEDAEEIRELEAELIDFTRGVTWQRVMRPSLLRRQDDISRKLCTNSRMTLEEVRELQTLYGFIANILENPIRFFATRNES